MSAARVTALTPAEHRARPRPALVRLLRVVTGDDRHLEEPVAWLCGRTGYGVHRERRSPTGAHGGALVLRREGDDGVARGYAEHEYHRAVSALWRAWVADRGWTFPSGTEGAVAPSGALYRWPTRDDWQLPEAVVVACGREGANVREELAASEWLLRRVCGEGVEAVARLALWCVREAAG